MFDMPILKFVHNVIFCTIWYQLYKLKIVKNIHGEVLLFLIKVALLHGWFSHFLSCTNDTKSHNASQIWRNEKN